MNKFFDFEEDDDLISSEELEYEDRNRIRKLRGSRPKKNKDGSNKEDDSKKKNRDYRQFKDRE